MVIHDFDEIGAPSTADVRWRQRGMQTWLRRVLDYQDEGLDVLLTGQSPLGEHLDARRPAMGVTTIDTTAQPVEHTAITIQRWIAQARADQPSARLALTRGWLTP